MPHRSSNASLQTLSDQHPANAMIAIAAKGQIVSLGCRRDDPEKGSSVHFSGSAVVKSKNRLDVDGDAVGFSPLETAVLVLSSTRGADVLSAPGALRVGIPVVTEPMAPSMDSSPDAVPAALVPATLDDARSALNVDVLMAVTLIALELVGMCVACALGVDPPGLVVVSAEAAAVTERVGLTASATHTSVPDHLLYRELSAKIAAPPKEQLTNGSELPKALT